MYNYREGFPILDKYIYANTASSGLINESTIEWRKQHDRDFLNGASTMRMNSSKIITDTTSAVGAFFGCSYENVALVQNFSLGLNMLLEGIDKGKKVLLLENDYPSVNWAFENRGFPISYCKINEDLKENILKKIKSDTISILALSLIQWVNGIKIDMDFLKQLKKEHPEVLIIADGTQFCGTTKFNFEESGLDVLGSSSYKWLLAGYGNGFMLFKDRVKEISRIETIGFNSANVDPNGRDKIRFAKHFEPGHLDTLNFGSLRHSLGLLNTIGQDNITQKLKKLSARAKEEFSALGLLEDIVLLRKDHSTIFNIKGNDAVFDHLANNGILCSQRGDGIRLSFHFYNTYEDIERIIEILNKVL
jgi:selenocysteine lyase/cysteine desulfurase